MNNLEKNGYLDDFSDDRKAEFSEYIKKWRQNHPLGYDNWIDNFNFDTYESVLWGGNDPENIEDIYDSQTLNSEQIPEFIMDAQAIIDYAWDLNASISIECSFMPEDGQAEKMLRLDLDEKSKITVESCRIEIE